MPAGLINQILVCIFAVGLEQRMITLPFFWSHVLRLCSTGR